jgi:hypothetical protein
MSYRNFTKKVDTNYYTYKRSECYKWNSQYSPKFYIITTEPVAEITTRNVPTSSAKNFF